MGYGYRDDNSDYLYHWIKNTRRWKDTENAYDDAFVSMESIIEDQFIYSGEAMGLTRNSCISFTESVKSEIIRDRSLYQPFGFEFRKIDIHNLGGRTAIYSPSEEKAELGEKHQWRHVKFDLNDTSNGKEKGHDFTWEREWRLNSSRLSLLECTGIYVPNSYYKNKVRAILKGIISLDAYENSLNNGVCYHSKDTDEFCSFIAERVHIL